MAGERGSSLKRRNLREVDTYESEVAKGKEEAGSGSQWRLLGLLLAFRVVNALLSFSAFVPDEYWQALEVAHNMVFGYPFFTVT